MKKAWIRFGVLAALGILVSLAINVCDKRTLAAK